MLSQMLMGATGELEVDLSENLIHHYLLNNNADDCVGDSDGTREGLYEFHGDCGHRPTDTVDYASYVDTNLDNSVALELISFWVYTDVEINSGSGVNIFGMINKSNKYNYMSLGSTTSYAENETFIVSQNGANFFWIVDIIPVGWFNIAIRWNGSEYDVYLDGQAKTVFRHGTIGKQNLDVLIGQRTADGDNSVGGSTKPFSNLRIYSDPKSDHFIQALYEEGYYPKPLPLPTTDGLIAHYPLTGTAEDSIGSYDGIENGVTYVDDTEFGSVLDLSKGFSEASDINISNVVLPQEHTFMLWVRPTGTRYQENYSYLLDSSLGRTIYSSYAPSSDNIHVYDGSSWHTLSYILINNIWTHVAFSQKDGLLYLYINGKINSTYNIIMLSIGGTTKFFTAYSDGAYHSNHQGLSRNIRLYNKGLLSKEIEDIYNYEKNFRPIDIDDGLIAYYPLKQNSMDNYNNEFDGINEESITYDGVKANFVKSDTSGMQIPSNINMENNSLMFWGSSTDIGGFVFFVFVNNGGSNRYYVYFSAGRLSCYIGLDSSSLELCDGLIYDEMNHFALIKTSPTTLDFYLDGKYIKSINLTAFVSLASTNYVGATNNTTSHLDGSLSNMRVYETVPTAEQIEVIYNTEKGDFI